MNKVCDLEVVLIKVARGVVILALDLFVWGLKWLIPTTLCE